MALERPRPDGLAVIKQKYFTLIALTFLLWHRFLA